RARHRFVAGGRFRRRPPRRFQSRGPCDTGRKKKEGRRKKDFFLLLPSSFFLLPFFSFTKDSPEGNVELRIAELVSECLRARGNDPLATQHVVRELAKYELQCKRRRWHERRSAQSRS